jgi:polyhydroxyalkanoate synthase subunit PhaC
MNGTGWWFEFLDQVRKLHGNVLDGIGLGPDESTYRIAFSRRTVRLRFYGTERPGSPVLLIVPAPIKRPYIWDLSPERSVVRRAIDHGFEVYLVEWTKPDDQETLLGLEEYAGTMLDECMDVIAERSLSDKVFLAGHSLGGTFAALYGAYRPKRIAGLILIEAPLHFAEASGAFGTLLNLGVPAKAAIPSSGRIPGSLLNLISASAAPSTFHVDRYLDYMASLASREDLRTHWRVERWALDELPLPRKLFEDVVGQLYREDRFMRGELMVGSARLHPRDIASPLFAVYEPSSRIVPPESVIEFHHAAGSQDKELMPYLGDTGVALKHVGALVGDSAHRYIWPQVFDWLKRVGAQ